MKLSATSTRAQQRRSRQQQQRPSHPTARLPTSSATGISLVPASSRPLLVILVLSRSTSDGRIRRDAIVRSWAGGPSQWPPLDEVAQVGKFGSRPAVRTLFVVGGARDPSVEGVRKGEFSHRGVDELRVAAPEGLRTIAIKVIRAMSWLYHSPDGLAPRFVAKTDDDTYICVAHLLEVTAAAAANATAASSPVQHSNSSMSPTPPLYLYAGAQTRGRPVEMTEGGKWEDQPYVRLFGLPTYPTYAQGALYVISAAAARAALGDARRRSLLDTSQHPNPTTTPVNEDALIGTLLHLALGQHVVYADLPLRVYPRNHGHSRGMDPRLPSIHSGHMLRE